MLPWSGTLAGRIEHRTINSDLLRDNPLGDPAGRVPDEIVSYELFEGAHSGIDYRYPLALARLGHRIAG